MKSVIIIAIAFVLLIPLSAFADPESSGFELVIELPSSDAVDFSFYATTNEVNNFERLESFILNSGEPLTKLEIITGEMGQGGQAPQEGLNNVSRWTSDGLETLEYGIYWTELRAHSDIKSIAHQIIELVNDGMSLESAFNFFSYVKEQHIPELEPSEEEIMEEEVMMEEIIQDSIVVTTDKASYSDGETILITGEVQDLYGIPVSIIIKSPSDDLVSILQVNVGADKKFSIELNAGSTLMNISGTYTITAQYGNTNRSAETSFEFGGVMAETMEEETM